MDDEQQPTPDFSVVERPIGLRGKTSAVDPKKLEAIRSTVETGKAIFFPLNGKTMTQLRGVMSQNYRRQLFYFGLRIHVSEATDKSGVFVWAEKITSKDEK